LWSGQGVPGFFNDFWRGSGVSTLGEFFGGEEFGVAVGAVARTQEVEEALLANGDVGGGSLRSGGCRDEIRGFFAPLRMTILNSGRHVALRGRCRGCWSHRGEGLHGDLESVDHLAGAAGVDGVLCEAVDDGGEGDEDAGAVLDGGNIHAGDLGVDEDAAAVAGGVPDVVVVAIIFTFECGRAATLAGWSLVMVTLLVAAEVWHWCRHGVPPLGIDWCMIFQTNQLRTSQFSRS